MDNDKGDFSGSVYLFSTTDGSLIHEAFDYFGWSVSLSNDAVAVGSIWDNDKGIMSTLFIKVHSEIKKNFLDLQTEQSFLFVIWLFICM